MNYSSSDADEDTITYNIYINGTLNISTTVNVTQWNASDGYYNLTVTAYDGINSSANSSVIRFTLDSIAPTVNIIYPDGLNISSNSSRSLFASLNTDSFCSINCRNRTGELNKSKRKKKSEALRWTGMIS